MAFHNLEFSVLYFFQQLHNPLLDKIMVFISSTGDTGFIWIVLSLFLLCFKRTRKVGVTALLAMLLGFLVGNVVLKNLIARPRPCWIDESIPLLIENPWDYSFPSGHSIAAFAAAFSIFLSHRGWGAGALCYAGLMAFSRMYLFVHFPTDVAAGILIGVAMAILAKKIVVWRPERVRRS